ncbi:MAG: glycosyltransferase family 4 protein [Verrucomicrobia bacterium]|nr:glycosyltransferase family 4 protein [Verrucomicrobiota bacterium]
MIMKVVLFTRYPPTPQEPRGGVESVTVVLVRALAAMDDLDVHVVTLDRDGAAAVVETHDGATVHRLPTSRWRQFADVLCGPGRHRLIDYILSLKPDILHSHETHGLTLGRLPIPHVFTLHGFDSINLRADAARFAALRSLLWGMLERRGLARQRHIISISPYVRRVIEPLTAAVIHDIENPVDERFFAINPAPQGLRVLCAGWLNERKNTLQAIKGFGLTVARGVGGTLVIAGQAKEPAYHQRVLDCIARHKLADRVELLGHIDHRRLMEQLGKATVFLLPSRQENSPMAIAEAMAAGLPVIASNRCGMPFMVTENETGFLIEPEDTEQIAERLARLLQDPALARQMGQAGRRVAEQRFAPRMVAEQTRAVYQELLNSNSRMSTTDLTDRHGL